MPDFFAVAALTRFEAILDLTATGCLAAFGFADRDLAATDLVARPAGGAGLAAATRLAFERLAAAGTAATRVVLTGSAVADRAAGFLTAMTCFLFDVPAAVLLLPALAGATARGLFGFRCGFATVRATARTGAAFAVLG